VRHAEGKKVRKQTQEAKKVGATRGGKEGTKGNTGSKESRRDMRRERRHERKQTKKLRSNEGMKTITFAQTMSSAYEISAIPALAATFNALESKSLTVWLQQIMHYTRKFH
jgi:hypothetical protein